MREASLQSKVLNELTKRGHFRVNMYGSGYTAKGVPDVIACVCGYFVSFELKVKNNQPTPIQRMQAKKIQNAGGTHFTIWTFDEFMEALREVEERK